MLVLSPAAHAQHTRFTDGLAIGDLADAGLKAETVCGGEPELPPLPGSAPARTRPSFAGEIYGSVLRDADRRRKAGVATVRVHLTPPGSCSWDVHASLIASTRGGGGAHAEAKLLLPQGSIGGVALFATGRYVNDSLAARELHLDREIAAGVSYTTFNVYPFTIGLIARLFGDTTTRLDLRARISGSAVAAGESVIRPGAGSGGVLRRAGFLTMLHVLHFPVSIVYEAEETNRFITERDWRRHNLAAVYRLSEKHSTSVVLRRTVQGLSRDARDREWAVHLSKLVF